MSDARVLFAGTPEFARASLAAMIDSGTRPTAVYTQPDRPAGRGKQLSASPVKECAIAHDIPVVQPATLRDDAAVDEMRAFEPDLLVVAAYGLILPQSILDIPASGCLNVHASLLPRWRGAAPIQAAILEGDERTGISLMSMTAGLDCGPVYATRETAIAETDTAGDLHDRLATMGGELLVEYLPAILAGDIAAVEQDESLATYAGKVKPADAELDWSRPAAELARHVRAYNPVPGAWFMVNGERVKCWEAGTLDAAGAAPGTVTDAGADGIAVACGEQSLVLTQLQRPGKRPVSAREFLDQVPLADRTLG